EAIRAALTAGKIHRGSSVDAVRFQLDEALPAWAVKGAWEEVRAAIPDPAPASPEWDGQGAPPDDPPDHLATLDHPDPDRERPTIRIVAGELTRTILECIRALGENDGNLFQRAGQLVTIVRESERREPYEADARRGSDILTRPGTPKLHDAGPMLLERADAAARWERFDARRGDREKGHGGKASGEWVPANPDPTTIRQVAVRKQWPGVRPIRGIIETPCLAPSGRVVLAPGYDEETGYMLLPSCDVGTIADAPPRKHAEAALRWLWIETACDFPFRGLGESDPDADPDRVARFTKALAIPDAFVGIASLLAIFARGAIAGSVPGALFEAAGQGSGKSLQIHVQAMIATSRPAGVATFPTRDGKPDDVELEKVLGGYALSGARFVAFDNIRGLLAGATLEKVLTAVETVDLRILGASGQHTLPWWAVLLFSGNNMVMSDDVAQRLLVSRLESSWEDPRARPSATFRHPDLLGWIKEHRARLVRACLVILRSFIAARAAGLDVPDPGTRGSFEAWSRIIPGALMWAGGPNILQAFPEAGRGGDEEGEAHMMLMRQWRAEWDGQKASTILEAIFRGEKEALEDAKSGRPDLMADARAAVRALTKCRERDQPSAHAFGMKLRGLRGKIRGGMKIYTEVDKASRAAVYWMIGPPAKPTTKETPHGP
ncbi:MAG TPA: hypothetical protein VNI01_02035, partial [Elusimicrobiota bacterium]|nr:hypothetical protein [Elusimicrobiota bacterium]